MALAQRAEQHVPRRARRLKAKAPQGKPKVKKEAGRSSNVINLRADAGTRQLIDNAAEVLGQNRTEFMLMSARIRAQEVLLSRVHFVLPDAAWAEFQAELEAPPIPTKELVALMASTPPWAD